MNMTITMIITITITSITNTKPPPTLLTTLFSGGDEGDGFQNLRPEA